MEAIMLSTIVIGIIGVLMVAVPAFLYFAVLLLAACIVVYLELQQFFGELRYLIKLESERQPQFGPFRTHAAEEGYVKVSLLPMLYASVGPLLEKLDAAVVSRLDRAEELCVSAWHSRPAQLIGRLSLTSTFLLGVFWGSAYLFGNEPAQVTSFSCMYYGWPLVEGFAISRMWDVLLAPVAVLTFVGVLWLNARVVFGAKAMEICTDLLRPLAVLFGGIGLLLSLIAVPGLAESRSWWSLLSLLPLTAIIIMIFVTVFGVVSEVIESAKTFDANDCSDIFRNVNCHRTGTLLFGCCAVGGVFGGLFFWGLPIGLAIGIGSGIALGGFVTCCSYLLAFIVRLVMSVPRFLRWQFAAAVR